MNIAVVLDSTGTYVSHGVDRTAQATVAELRTYGHTATLVTTATGLVICTMPGHKHVPVYLPFSGVQKALRALAPDVVAVLTEGFLGLEALLWAKFHHVPVVMSYNTKWPEYLARYTKTCLGTGGAQRVERAAYKLLARLYHVPDRMIVVTSGLRDELTAKGFPTDTIRVWGRAVDTAAFYPRTHRPDVLIDRENVILYVGRVSTEKNLEALCDLHHLGTIVVVGDGPARHTLERRYPHVLFVGHKSGDELAEYYSAADVFAFPSKTDTFGLVMLEALACGTPIAAYPVTGPNEVVTATDTGCLNNSLEQAVRICLSWRGKHREACVRYARTHNWHAVTAQLVNTLEEVTGPR